MYFVYFYRFWRLLAVYDLVNCVRNSIFCAFKSAIRHNIPTLAIHAGVNIHVCIPPNMVKFVALLGLLGSIYEFGDCSNDMCTSGQDGSMSGSFESNHPYDLGINGENIHREWCLTPPAGKSVKVSFGGFKSESWSDGLAIKVDGQTHVFSGDNNVPNSGFVSMEGEHVVKPRSTGGFGDTRVGNDSKTSS